MSNGINAVDVNVKKKKKEETVHPSVSDGIKARGYGC